MSEPTKTVETPAAPIEKAVADGNLTLEKRIENVINDVFAFKLKALEQRLDEKIENLLKAKEIEMEQALRKGFGLENDPTVHKSDMIAFFRKAQLETAESQKKTPASLEKAGPEGNKPTNPIDQVFDNFGGKA